MKRFRLPFILIAAVPLCLAMLWLVNTSRAATESPEYTLVARDGKVEICDYPALTLATTPMLDAKSNDGFGKLFRFITGSNERSQKIEMTAPVLIDREAGQSTMSFIMPRKTVDTGVPNPTGGSVILGKMDAARYAVLRFEGRQTAENERNAIATLRGWLAEQDVTAKGDAVFAYYDPPWTPIPWRRNEVMVRISK